MNIRRRRVHAELGTQRPAGLAGLNDALSQLVLSEYLDGTTLENLHLLGDCDCHKFVLTGRM
jgi:hypothetical protein